MVARNRFDPDDARLSAYALGELDESERNAVEELLEKDAEARAFVEGLRETVAQVERAFAEGDAARLTEEQREVVRAQAAGGTRSTRQPWSRWKRVALAASILVATAAGAWIATNRWRTTPNGFESEPVLSARTASKPGEVWRHHDTAANPAQRLQSLGYSSGIEVGGAQLQARLSATYESGGAPLFFGPELRRADKLAVRAELGYLEASEQPSAEQYDSITEHAFRLTREEALSTFSIDVDTASYANVRRFLRNGQLPPAGAVRVEELINYFDYDYPQPAGSTPFSVTADSLACPWAPQHRLVRIGLKGLEVHSNERKDSHLVFLLDVSGSMSGADKLPLVQRALRMLTEQLDVRDRVSIVVYAGSEGLVLPPTSGRDRGAILEALERLQTGGSTNGGAGIQLAYRMARENFIDGGVNRVILCTDGDFNVGVTSRDELVRLIEEERKSGVFLSVLGFGTGNLKDAQMEQLADKGNGSYAYIDSLSEARKVLVEQMSGTLQTIAKDVKIQVEFNPAQVQAWRQIGYENRALAHQDFADDTKDAGEIGAGHTVTALYEIVPVGVPFEAPQVGEMRYQQPRDAAPSSFGDELMFVKLRYKAPDGDTSRLIEQPVRAANLAWNQAPADARFAAAVAAFGMKLRGSQHVAELSFAQIGTLASEALGRDARGWRIEFLDLVRKADELAR